MESACTLAIEAEVLGEGLRNAELKALGDEVADSPGIVLKVARSEPLVSAVEKGEMFFGTNQF